MTNTTLKEIAQKLGISITTVSKALKNYPDVSEKTRNAVLELAKNNSTFFYAKFQEIFPVFCSNLIKKSSTLVITEMQLCAYLKLNFTTKEIAFYTKSTVQGVNQKKYRLRKKLNISSDEDLNVWMTNV